MISNTKTPRWFSLFKLNYLPSFAKKSKLKSHENLCKDKDFCGIVMAPGKYNILEFNQYMKLDKIPYIIYVDIEFLIRKTEGCGNNPEKASATKLGEHFPCGYSMSTIWAFDYIENKHTLYCEKYCMENFCSSLKEHATDILKFEKIEMLSLTKNNENHTKMQQIITFVEENS